MNKKILALLMSIFTMVCFMPSMAFATEVPAHVHTYTTLVKDAGQTADCTNDGYEVYQCSYEGCTETVQANVVEKLGHSYSKQVVIAPTCTKDGVQYTICSRCGDPQMHKVTKEGKEVEEVMATVLPKLGHNFVTIQDKFYKAPTCILPGFQHVKCDTCGAEEYQYIPPTGHSYEWVITEAPTFSKDGTKKHVCSVCNTVDPFAQVINVPALTLEKANKPTVKIAKKSHKATITFKAVKNASAYKVAYKVKNGKWTYKTVTDPKFVTKALKVGKTYSFKVRALGIENETVVLSGAWSKVKSVNVK